MSNSGKSEVNFRSAPRLEDARLELARRRYEAVRTAVKENLELLEQLSREVRYGGWTDYE
jgi:uncharacterized protein (DUF1499 family)